MFSLIRKLPLQQFMRPLAVSNAAAAGAPSSMGIQKCYISTSDGVQNSEQLIKSVGGLPTDLVHEKQMKKTSR